MTFYFLLPTSYLRLGRDLELECELLARVRERRSHRPKVPMARRKGSRQPPGQKEGPRGKVRQAQYFGERPEAKDSLPLSDRFLFPTGRSRMSPEG